MIICPCCGARTGGDLRTEGCHSCGALAVGPPLARPERELPAFGLTLAVGVAGALVVLLFSVSTLSAFLERKTFSLGLWDFVGAAQTAAWRLRWVGLPLSVLAVYFGERVVRRVRRDPARFAGARLAHAGLAASALVAFASFALIGVTVPERLRLGREAAKAEENAAAYDSVKVLLEYQQQFGSLPANPDDLAKLPDPDGSVARAAAMLRGGRYEPDVALASLPQATATAPGRRDMSVSVRRVALRPGAEESPAERLAFTNYTLRLPGKDGRLGTGDDLFVRDGLIVPAPAEAKPAAPRSGAAREVKLP